MGGQTFYDAVHNVTLLVDVSLSASKAGGVSGGGIGDGIFPVGAMTWTTPKAESGDEHGKSFGARRLAP